MSQSAVTTWGEFEADHPSLAEFGVDRIQRRASYLATVRADGTPRVHPVMPVIGNGRLFLFMDPTSPKRHDLRASGSYARTHRRRRQRHRRRVLHHRHRPPLR